MIALAVNLAMSLGFRPAAQAIRICYDAFGLQKEITPSHDSILDWSKRLGVASMKQGRERILSAKKRIIMVDHSCQIGDEKLMVVMGMDADNLPELGQALRREDMEVLEVKAARQWKTEDMLREYRSMGVRDVCQRTVSASRCQCEAGRSDWRVETSRRVRTSQSIGEVRS